MAEPAIVDPPEAVPSSLNPQPPDFDIPFDPHFFSFDNNPNLAHTFHSDSDFDFDFDLTFDDIDALCLPQHDAASDGPPPLTNSSNGSSGISADRCPDVSAYLNQSPSESESYRSAEEDPEFVRVSDNREYSGGHVSSQGSGMNSASPSGDPDVSSADQKVKVEQTVNRSAPKRKNEQFDVALSSTKGAIISAPSVSNITTETRHNSSTQASGGQNRRALRGAFVPLSGSEFNETGGGKQENPSGENLPQGNNSLSSSMVVSVLLDPREAVDIEVDRVVPPPKSLTRIFVVVLIDSIKYVTYSCVLPHSGGPQLVTA